MPTRLGLYNDALRAIGDLRLSSITEDTEARYVLDDAWEDAVEFVFTEGLWNFATITAVITADLGQTPIPGFSFVFAKPANWIRTITISPNSLFSDEAVYRDENDRIYANFDTLYIRYLSNAKAADAEIAGWPTSFGKVVAAYLAKECCQRLSGSDTKAEALAEEYRDALASAKNKDALDQSKVLFKPGAWVRAMRGSSLIRDRGPLSGY
jgi:hypothetical protein